MFPTAPPQPAILAPQMAESLVESDAVKLRRQGQKMTICFFLPNFAVGGAERMTLNLMRALKDRGHNVVLVVTDNQGGLREAVPLGVEVVCLRRPSTLRALGPLVDTLRTRRPDVLISALGHNNIITLWARALARTGCKIIIQQHSVLSYQAREHGSWRQFILPTLYRLFARWADGIVAVSVGSADDMAKVAHIPREAITVIYNPVLGEDVAILAREPVDHPFFAPDQPPVFLAVGRLVSVKDFSTLLKAFKIARDTTPARLVILGEGPLRRSLLAECEDLGISDEVSLPGNSSNPFAYMSRAGALIVSSRFEGFGVVLAEALAVGASVVSTDCPYGPSEILDGGRYGRLVPIGDAPRMASAMLEALAEPISGDLARSRAEEFTADRIAQRYEDLFAEIYARECA